MGSRGAEAFNGQLYDGLVSCYELYELEMALVSVRQFTVSLLLETRKPARRGPGRHDRATDPCGSLESNRRSYPSLAASGL